MRYMIFILFSIILSPVAQAYQCTPASDYTVNVPTLYAASSLSQLYEPMGDIYTTGKRPLISCSNTANIYSMSIEFFAKGYNIPNDVGPNGNQVFLGNLDTLSGIVYTLGADADCGTGNWVKPGSNVISVCPGTALASVAPKVQFYQKYTGSAPASSVMRTQMGTFWVKINGNIVYSIPAYFTAFNVMIQPCKVTTSSVSVPMGNISKWQFSDITSTAGGSDFNISLQCTKAANVTLQIDPDGTAINRPLGLIPTKTGSGTASGVAIQLLNNNTGTPFFLGKAVNMSRTNVGANNISLKARYMQVADNITPGTANGSATFTVRYQ